MTDKAAVQLSGEFSKMAVDIGSFMMRDPDQIMGAFQSALMGNTMALRNYGVFLNETLLKETVAANRKKGLVFASERQARAYAVLTETQKQQADAIGDYAVEAANFGNQLRKFYGGISELPAKFGAGLLGPANEFLKVANSRIDRLRNMDDATWKTISTVTALGTAVTLGAAAWRVAREASVFYSAARIAATNATAAQALATQSQTAATAGSTAAITAETVALQANTAARTTNAASITLASAAARRLPPAASPRTPLPHQDRRNVWEEQRGTLRAAHSRVGNEILIAEAAHQAAARRVASATNPVERHRWVQRRNQAGHRVGSAMRKRDNLERNMQSLNEAQRRNPLNLTDRQRQERRAVMRQNVSRGRYARAQRTFSRRSSGFRRSPVGMVGRGIGSAVGTAGRVTGISFILRSFGTMVSRWIPAAARTWGATLLRSVATALLPLAGTALAILNPVGWAATILAGIAAVGNYLPTLMFKAYDGLMSLFSAENMSALWENFSSMAVSCFEKTVEYLGKGLYGIGLVAESIFFTVVNVLGNGLRAIINPIIRAANKIPGVNIKEIGRFEYKSSGYVAYEQQKKVNAMQAALDERRAEQAKREKQIAEFRSKVSEQEREWLQREEEILKKRSELAEGRFDSVAKENSIGNKLKFAESLTDSIDAAMKSVQSQLDTAKREYEAAVKSGDEDKQAAAREKYDASVARMEDLQKQKTSNTTGIAEMRYSLFDSQLENAGKAKGSQAPGFYSQMQAYKSLIQRVESRAGMAQGRQIESDYDTAQHELFEKQRLYNSALAAGDDMRTAGLKDEIESAEKRIAGAQTAYNELQANLSDQRKLQEKIDTLAEEQNKRHAEAKSTLWDFKFDNASSSKQQQMARSAFFEAQNRFEGAGSDEERDKALSDMQSMYGKMDMDKKAAEMPTWNGFLQTSAGAIESDSVAAQDLQERILTDFNTAMLDNTKQQTIIQKALQTAMEQVVKNTDPNQQPMVGGSV
jgi:hypothetical protein